MHDSFPLDIVCKGAPRFSVKESFFEYVTLGTSIVNFSGIRVRFVSRCIYMLLLLMHPIPLRVRCLCLSHFVKVLCLAVHGSQIAPALFHMAR